MLKIKKLSVCSLSCMEPVPSGVGAAWSRSHLESEPTQSRRSQKSSGSAILIGTRTPPLVPGRYRSRYLAGIWWWVWPRSCPEICGQVRSGTPSCIIVWKIQEQTISSQQNRNSPRHHPSFPLWTPLLPLPALLISQHSNVRCYDNLILTK